MLDQALDKAFAEPGARVAAWDYASDPAKGFGVAIYAVGDAGARRLAHAVVPAVQRDPITDALRARGARIGGIYGGAAIVWVIDDEGIEVWNDKRVVLAGSREVPVDGVSLDEVTEVVSTIDRRFVRRAVELESRSGERFVVAEEADEIAQLDPGYGDNELQASSAYWVTYLGRELSAWLRVPHRDEVFDLAIDFALVKAIHEIADRAAAMPATEAFPPITIAFTTAGGTRAQLDLAPSPTEPERFVEMRVFTPSGASNASRWLVNGSNQEIVRYLRRPDRLDRFTKILRELRESLQRSELA